MQDDRSSNVGGDHAATTPSDDHQGERDLRLSAKSLAARGDAPDGSEDGPSESREQADGSAEA
ncbi:MAG: hypothetical protein KY467_07625 [Gemmatimonadetes bacterium]|nr:hypothetical protein [Gemmatimonadota bacterium]